MSKEAVQQVKDYGKKHLEFMIRLYNIQVANGLYFLHEHPSQASSWNRPEMIALIGKIGRDKMVGDMCAFGMVQEDAMGIALIKKPTGYLTNADERDWGKDVIRGTGI